MAEKRQDWIDDVELADVPIKWNWSHIDGRPDTFNDEGDHNFTVILPKDVALDLLDKGWTAVKENPPYEEGDDPEWTLKIKISYKYEAPLIYLIKGDRKVRVRDAGDLAQIRRDNTERIDVIITPSRWVNGNRTGVTAYVKEMYAEIRESRFAQRYSDYQEI